MLRSLPRLLAFAVALLAAAPALAEDLRERDLDLLVRRSTVVARGEVVAVSPEGIADLHVQAAYLELGEKAELVRVRAEGERGMVPSPGDRGLFFLGPAQANPGALTFVQLDFERWQLEPDAAVDAAVDAFMTRLVAACTGDTPSPMDDVWIDGLFLPVLSLSTHCAHRLAAVAEHGGIGNRGWDRIFGWLQESPREESKAAAVRALAKVLPADRAVTLLPKLADGSKVKAALLAATGARASSSGDKAKEQARAALDAGGKDRSPEVALGAAVGLAALGDEKAIPALERALKSTEVSARHQAVDAMAALAGKGSRAARARLHKLFEDPDGIVRAKARTAWVDAYLADPVRQKRTQPSLMLVGAALVMILAVAGHSLLVRRRT
ncbi:MAG TPA: HEAT repeat domain-containing protein [Myxococcales bacterium]